MFRPTPAAPNNCLGTQVLFFNSARGVYLVEQSAVFGLLFLSSIPIWWPANILMGGGGGGAMGRGGDFSAEPRTSFLQTNKSFSAWVLDIKVCCHSEDLSNDSTKNAIFILSESNKGSS